jgi:hypothetical protein
MPEPSEKLIGMIHLHSKKGQTTSGEVPDSLFFSDDIKCTTYLTVMICLSELFFAS